MGLPPKQVLENSKRAKIFINAKGYPRYCVAKTLEDNSVVLSAGVSRRGIKRGLPGSRKLKEALNNCEDVYFVSFIKECLEWIPEKRLTPENAIKNSWFRRRLPKHPMQVGHMNTLPIQASSSSMIATTTKKVDESSQSNKLTASVIDNFHNNHMNNINSLTSSTLSLLSQNSANNNMNRISTKLPKVIGPQETNTAAALT